VLELLGEGLSNRQIAERLSPGREDGKELRRVAAQQTRYAAPQPGRRLRGPARRDPWHLISLMTKYLGLNAKDMVRPIRDFLLSRATSKSSTMDMARRTDAKRKLSHVNEATDRE